MHPETREIIRRNRDDELYEQLIQETLDKLIRDHGLVKAVPIGNESEAYIGNSGRFVVRLSLYVFPLPCLVVGISYGEVRHIGHTPIGECGIASATSVVTDGKVGWDLLLLAPKSRTSVPFFDGTVFDVDIIEHLKNGRRFSTTFKPHPRDLFAKWEEADRGW